MFYIYRETDYLGWWPSSGLIHVYEKVQVWEEWREAWTERGWFSFPPSKSPIIQHISYSIGQFCSLGQTLLCFPNPRCLFEKPFLALGRPLKAGVTFLWLKTKTRKLLLSSAPQKLVVAVAGAVYHWDLGYASGRCGSTWKGDIQRKDVDRVKILDSASYVGWIHVECFMVCTCSQFLPGIPLFSSSQSEDEDAVLLKTHHNFIICILPKIY